MSKIKYANNKEILQKVTGSAGEQPGAIEGA